MKRRCPAALLLVAGCAGEQSALAPAGDHAGRIADLSWLLFGGGVAIFLVVAGALALAIAGPANARRVLADHRMVVLGGIAFPTVVLTALLVFGVWLMRESIAPPGEPALTVEVAGEQWWWRVSYRTAAGQRIESANEIRVPTGRPVRFELATPDVIHSFWVPSLGGKVDMIPGRINTLTLTAEREGIYRGQCAEYCGGPHALMAFEVRAMPPQDFDAWLADAARPAASATGPGMELFLSAGCGSCHTVRGTEAAGKVGPDLSRVGARRHIAAATLPATPGNIAAFITNNQHVKPGNLMPRFDILPPDHVETLSSYLASLK